MNRERKKRNRRERWQRVQRCGSQCFHTWSDSRLYEIFVRLVTLSKLCCVGVVQKDKNRCDMTICITAMMENISIVSYYALAFILMCQQITFYMGTFFLIWTLRWSTLTWVGKSKDMFPLTGRSSVQHVQCILSPGVCVSEVLPNQQQPVCEPCCIDIVARVTQQGV